MSELARWSEGRLVATDDTGAVLSRFGGCAGYAPAHDACELWEAIIHLDATVREREATIAAHEAELARVRAAVPPTSLDYTMPPDEWIGWLTQRVAWLEGKIDSIVTAQDAAREAMRCSYADEGRSVAAIVELVKGPVAKRDEAIEMARAAVRGDTTTAPGERRGEGAKRNERIRIRGTHETQESVRYLEPQP